MRGEKTKLGFWVALDREREREREWGKVGTRKEARVLKNVTNLLVK